MVSEYDRLKSFDDGLTDFLMELEKELGINFDSVASRWCRTLVPFKLIKDMRKLVLRNRFEDEEDVIKHALYLFLYGKKRAYVVKERLEPSHKK